jgi:hypothetical protein
MELSYQFSKEDTFFVTIKLKLFILNTYL